MEKFIDWFKLFSNSLNSFGLQFMASLPSILGAFVILLVGWLLAKLVRSGLSKLLQLVKFDILADKVKVGDFLKKGNIETSASNIVSKFVYWLLLLFVVMTAADSMGWNTVSAGVSDLMSYLPQLFVALVFFIIGMYIASFVRDFIKGATAGLGISVGSLISNVVFYFLSIVVTLTAMKQAGFDTTIITSNLLIILGALMLTIAVSYALASRDIMKNFLSGHFTRNQYTVGQKIEIAGVQGEITSITTINFTLNTGSKEIVYPIHRLISEEITLLK